ncbi:uncharacterized protein LOC132601300 [Lycium barbarum]|uniref:uncharacterized protein LOC132601300 n=1 Tax=Lycium barbarum TaxID=112863 RepID=UPI00293E3556|nr:uncharacterized protein LOC132601300 [Lycium barbarum]
MQQKLKRLACCLSNWSRNSIGNVFDRVKDLEQKIETVKAEYGENNTDEARSKLQGQWIQGSDLISDAAIQYYNQLFTQPQQDYDLKFLKRMEPIVTDEDNDMLMKLPSVKDIKEAVGGLHPDNASGPDGFNGHFFRKCCPIIAEDLCAMVLNFFRGHKLSRYITHICLILLPKVELAGLLPKLISPNQTGFVKGRLIKGNVFLTRDIVHDIKKKNKGGNVVIKIDMAKAYDKVSWGFLNVVLRSMGFKKRYVDLIYRLTSNVWYSVMIYGTRYGFFHSTRGLKQGDPLSPALFILASESLTKAFNHLHDKEGYRGFTVNPNGPQVNHLCYADDQYLGCPIYHRRQRIAYFTDITKAVVNKIKGWQGNLLSTGGRATLINHLRVAQVSKALWISVKLFCAKRWWRFRGEDNLWSLFLKVEYYQRKHPVARLIQSGQSTAWRDLLKIRSQVETHISWKINEGKNSFWWDNWTNQCPLINNMNKQEATGTLMVDDCLDMNGWDRDFISNLVPPNIAQVIFDIPIVETIRPRFSSILVKWEKPPNDWLKINTDGSSNSSMQMAGIGGVARSTCGEIIMAYAKSLQFCTNNRAKVEVVEYAILWYSRSLKPLATFTVRDKVWYCREANQVADTLAKHGASSQMGTNPETYYTTHEMPRQAIGSSRMDNMGMPSFRIRKIQRSYQTTIT